MARIHGLLQSHQQYVQVIELASLSANTSHLRQFHYLWVTWY
jgi:hypothetical protein